MAERSYDEKWRTRKVELASLYKQERWTKDRKLDDIKIMLSHTEGQKLNDGAMIMACCFHKNARAHPRSSGLQFFYIVKKGS
jgi:hypothetical protein